MKKLLVSLILLAGVVNNAHAEWTTVAWNSKTKQEILAIDYQRFFTSNGLLYVWWKDFSLSNFANVKRPNNHLIVFYRSRIDCRTQMILNDYSQTAEVKYFSDPNPEIYEQPWNGPGQWFVPSIGSTEEFIVNTICKKV